MDRPRRLPEAHNFLLCETPWELSALCVRLPIQPHADKRRPKPDSRHRDKISFRMHQLPFGPQWKSYGTGCGAGAATACAIPSNEPDVATGAGRATAGIGDSLRGGQGGRSAASITGCTRAVEGTGRGADATALAAGAARGCSTGACGVSTATGFGGGAGTAAGGGGIGGGEADATGTFGGGAAAGTGAGCGGGTGGSRLSSAAIEVNWLGFVVFRLRNWLASVCNRSG